MVVALPTPAQSLSTPEASPSVFLYRIDIKFLFTHLVLLCHFKIILNEFTAETQRTLSFHRENKTKFGSFSMN